jgi:hypothetical protein
MASYSVTVTASYNAARAPRDTLDRLKAWVEIRDGRTLTVDDSIAPVRWTITADYVVEAQSARDAEAMAVDGFVAESSQADITAPETVLAATGPLA